MDILTPVITLGVLGLIFGVGLAVASKKFAVKMDPRLEKIHGLLPGANCGACGGAGCFGFAESVLSGKLPVDSCRVVDDKNKEEIAKVLGQKIENKARKIAVLHCSGGNKVKNKYEYSGLIDCVAANTLMHGPKLCSFGCMGLGTCVKACPFGALSMSSQGLPLVDAAKCRACNKCVTACPKKLFSLLTVTQPVYVACRSLDIGRDTKAACSTGCIGCKLCEKACKFDAIHVTDNLAVIDYHKCTSCKECVKACPCKTILIREEKS
ncbi:MAG: RnfABCDGE type electron transport complex subunit B [Candidatus Omnitrophica bacterium]|nr:RnfABCDGE type electron transport complex subunit B [Candidatus Omnitrophota bacterium]